MYALLQAYGQIDRNGLGLNCGIDYIERTKTRIQERLRNSVKLAQSDGFKVSHRGHDGMSVQLLKDTDEAVLFIVEELE